MVRPALEANRAEAISLPAPVGGWNARDNLAGMPPTDALQMDNMIPDVNKVKLRSGDAEYATGLSGNVESLITHISDSAEKFLAASDGNIYNVSSSGAVGAALEGSLANARWIWDNFGDVTLMVNGADSPRSYDGTSITTPSFTGSGLTTSNLNSVTQVRDRLWFTEKDKAWVWYGGIGSISGTLTKFDLSQIATGGHCVRVTDFSRDAGDGMNDFTVFIMSTGQVIIYSRDPAISFTLEGKYQTQPPIGKNCFIKQGGEVILITRGGYVPLSVVIQQGDQSKNFISDKIRDAVATDVNNAGANFGWQAIRSPDGKFLIFNVPKTTNSEYEQHLFNLFTGAWCRFKDRDARVFGVYNDTLYFGHSTKIYEADTGTTDVSNSSANINGTVQQAFTPLGDSGVKQVTLMKPALEAGGTATISFVVKADFDVSEVTAGLQTLNPSIQTWETIDTNWEDMEDNWDAGAGVISPTIVANALGDYVSIVAKADTADFFNWYSTALVFQRGGLI